MFKTYKSTGRICWHNILENKMESIDRMGTNHLVDARDVTNKAIWMALNNFTDKEIEEKSELIYQSGIYESAGHVRNHTDPLVVTFRGSL